MQIRTRFYGPLIFVEQADILSVGLQLKTELKILETHFSKRDWKVVNETIFKR